MNRFRLFLQVAGVALAAATSLGVRTDASAATAGAGADDSDQAITLRSSIDTGEQHAGADRPLPVDCGSSAARFDGPRGIGLWVLRTGSVVAENPLRPLTPDTLLVLAVAVDGRVATAYGPDYASMRQAGPPQRVEAELGTRIGWDATVSPRSVSFSTVDRDGRSAVGPFTFSHCGPAPETTAAVTRAPAAGSATDTPSRPERSAVRPKLPQGALPESGIRGTPPTLARP